MSFPDANSPSFPAGFLPQFAMNPDHSDLHPRPHLRHDEVPPFKRPRNLEYNPPNSAPFQPNYPKMNPPNFPGGKGTGHIFYKTRMCAKFLEGTCRNGENCSFAHGKEDLREPPPNWQELMREKERGPGNWSDDQRNIQRMKICKRYWNGEDCSYGEKCTFLHERPMEKQRESSAISIGTSGHIEGNGNMYEQLENKHVNINSDAFRVKPIFWKTKMCTKWEVTGHCHFGERCHYAHGLAELKVPSGGGRIQIQSEPVMNHHPGPVPLKPLSIPVLDPAPANLIANPPTNGEGGGIKNISKWNSTRKINRIYADWIDDLSPPHDSPSDAEV